MTEFLNPALAAFRAQLAEPTEFVEVLISRCDEGYDLRHRADGSRTNAELQLLSTASLGVWADFTNTGAFRPNKTAPNLRRGWRSLAANDQELELALDALYPGALADWFAEHSGSSPATSFREFTARQSGMYRCTQRLSDAQAGQVTLAVCHPQFCLRRRRWEAPQTLVDSPESKSLIPCWEPCALLLEFARKTARIAEEDPIGESLRPSEVESLAAALRIALGSTGFEVREGDSNHPANPRRLRLLLDRLEGAKAPNAAAGKET